MVIFVERLGPGDYVLEEFSTHNEAIAAMFAAEHEGRHVNVFDGPDLPILKQNHWQIAIGKWKQNETIHHG
jgi:hypothetical protein